MSVLLNTEKCPFPELEHEPRSKWLDYMPQPGWLMCERARMDRHTDGGLYLPDVAEMHEWDCTVMAHSASETGFNIGDRLLIRFYHWRSLEPWLGLVKTVDVVARKAWNGADWEPLTPCGEHLMFVPDPMPEVEERPSGVLVASAVMGGAEMRLKRRGQELYEQLRALGETEAFKAEPDTYYQHRRVWDFCSHLSPDEIAALKEAVKKKGDTRWRALQPIGLKRHPRSGVLVAKGPQAPDVPVLKRVHWEPGEYVLAREADEATVFVPGDRLMFWED